MSPSLEISGREGTGDPERRRVHAGERIIYAIKEGARARVHENMSDNACHLIHVK